jgi:hypothetical protein
VLDGRPPTLIKLDVEGFETEVPAGAQLALADPGLMAVMMELNGSRVRYGFDEDALHRELLGRGFATCLYRPLVRVLEPLHGARSGSGNTLNVRNAVGWRNGCERRRGFGWGRGRRSQFGDGRWGQRCPEIPIPGPGLGILRGRRGRQNRARGVAVSR